MEKQKEKHIKHQTNAHAIPWSWYFTNFNASIDFMESKSQNDANTYFNAINTQNSSRKSLKSTDQLISAAKHVKESI